MHFNELSGHLGIWSRGENSWLRKHDCDVTPKSSGDDDVDGDDDAVFRALSGRRLRCPLPASSIVSLSASGQPHVGRSFPAVPCTRRTAVDKTETRWEGLERRNQNTWKDDIKKRREEKDGKRHLSIETRKIHN